MAKISVVEHSPINGSDDTGTAIFVHLDNGITKCLRIREPYTDEILCAGLRNLATEIKNGVNTNG